MGICYHYCNVDAFLSIIRNKVLWLSDVKKSNDPWEGGKVFQDILDYYSSQRWKKDGYDPNELSRLMDLVMEYDDEMRLYNDFYAYAICFSESGDLLSQWRGYTQDAAGISLGFDENILKKWSLSHSGKKIAEYKKIRYGEQEQDIKRVIDDLLKLGSDIDLSGTPSDIDRLSHPFYQYLEKKAIDSFFVKDKGFREEKEKRLLYREYYHSDDNQCLDLWEHSASKEVNIKISEFSLSDVKYQCWAKGFKKYYELSFEKVKDRFIRKVIVGPKCTVSVEDVEELLIREGYPLTGKNRICVKKSEIIMR